MSHPSSRLVVISAAVLGLLAGCNGSGGGADTGSARDGPERSAERTTTTAPPAGIDLSEPIPGGSLHGTPRPPLENTGDDYVAIFESLMINFRWLTENPDPNLLSELFVPGTPGHDERVGAYKYLVDNGYRWADEGYQLISVDVVDTGPALVSLTVLQRLDFEQIVDANGNQVGERRPHGGPQTVNFVIASDGEGRWRIADATSAGEAVVEV